MLLELDSLEGDAKLMADPIPVRKLSAYVKNFFFGSGMSNLGIVIKILIPDLFSIS